jgi:hypothetical protein
MVASRGEGGILNLAGVSQANSVMFLVGTLGAGLVTTGMIYGKTREGYAAFVKVNSLLAAAAGVIQLLLCIPPIGHTVFGHLIGLPAGIEGPARIALLSAVPLQVLFFLRNPYQAALYAHNATGKAGGATILRIIATAGLSPIFSAQGLVGPFWAVVCMTLPVAGEVILSWWFSRPFLAALSAEKKKAPRIADLVAFTMPLSAGGFFLTLSGILIGAVIARAADPSLMLPAYYLATGLSAPMAFAASRVQAVTVAFAPDHTGLRTIFRFTLFAGAVCGLVPLFFILPGLADWYYVGLQKCSVDRLYLVRWSALSLIFQPLVVALRAFCEGRAAVKRNSIAILAGQAVFLGMLAVVSMLCLAIPVPGNLIAPIGLFAANIAAAAIVLLAMRIRAVRGPVPLAPGDGTEGVE